MSKQKPFPRPPPTTMYVIEMREPGHPSAYVLNIHGSFFLTEESARTYIKAMHPTMHLDGRKYKVKVVIVGGKEGAEIQS